MFHDLITAHERIRQLERDLAAEIVIQHEISHTERVCTETDSVMKWGDPGSDETVIDQPRKTAPDTKTRREAAEQLQQIHDSSDWCSARYKAATVLRMPYNQIDKNLGLWIANLRKNMDATKEVEAVYTSTNPFSATGSSYVDEPYNTLIPDLEKVLPAVDDSLQLLFLSHSSKVAGLLREKLESGREEVRGRIRTSLEKMYCDKNSDVRDQRLAAQTLGYSDLRIWAHEHPAMAASTVILASSAAGLGYFLSKYLVK